MKYRRSKKPFIVDLVLLNVLSLYNRENDVFFFIWKANEKMPFIIIVLRRVIRWHGMEHLLCVWMTRRFFFLVSKIDSKRGESFYVEIWFFLKFYMVSKKMRQNFIYLFIFIQGTFWCIKIVNIRKN